MTIANRPARNTRPPSTTPVGDHERRAVARPDEVGEHDQPGQRKQDQTRHHQRREEQPAPMPVRRLEVLGDPAERPLPRLERTREEAGFLLRDRRRRDAIEHPALAEVRHQPREAPRPTRPQPFARLHQQLGHRTLAIQQLHQLRVLLTHPHERPLAQITEHVTLMIGLIIEPLQSPPRPQPRPQRAVTRRHRRRAQPHLGRADRNHERRVRIRNRPRRVGQPDPAGDRGARRHRALHPQHDIPSWISCPANSRRGSDNG